jgi:hypothetical protein
MMVRDARASPALLTMRGASDLILRRRVAPSRRTQPAAIQEILS